MIVRQPIKPQPCGLQRVIQGLAYVTHGMNPAADGAVWYIADGIRPGTELRCPLGEVGERITVGEDTMKIVSVTAERLRNGYWVWRVEVKPAPPEPAGSDEAAPQS